MGQDYKCGCRRSLSGWYLCDKHEGELIIDLEEYVEE